MNIEYNRAYKENMPRAEEKDVQKLLTRTIITQANII